MPRTYQLTPAGWAQVGSTRALTPEIVDRRVADVEALARWFDYAFELPGGFRFGLAGIIGLIPAIGDIVDALISMYIVARAVQLGIPRIALLRMLLNIGIGGAAGSVPFLGDLFDIAFKANRRNYHILRNHLSGSKRQRKEDWLFVAAALLLGLAAVALPVLLLVEIARHF